MNKILPWLERGSQAGILIFLLFTFSPTLTEIGFIVVLMCAFVRAVLLRDVSWRATPLDWILGLFFLVMILSCIFSTAPIHSFAQIKLLRFFALVYAVHYLALEERFTRWALVGFIMSLSILSLYSVSQYLLGREFLPWFYEKLQWEGRIQPGIGQIALCAALPCLGFLGWGRFPRRKSAVFIGSLALLLATMYYSYARSVWLAFAASGFTLGWMQSRKIGMVALSLGIIVAGIFLALPQTKVGGLLHSIGAPTNPDSPRYASNMERVRMARETMDIVRKKPILGVGFDAYRLYTRSPLKRISSDYLQFLANTGILGLLAYVLLLGSAVRLAMRAIPLTGTGKKAVAMGTLGFLIAFAVCGAFEPMFYGTRTLRLMPFFLALVREET